jgi:hypothetical protein
MSKVYLWTDGRADDIVQLGDRICTIRGCKSGSGAGDQQGRRCGTSNRADSVAKLHDVICTTAQSMIVKPTSEEQKLKVRDLMGKDAARRKAEKVKKSMKKESRRKGGWD